MSLAWSAANFDETVFDAPEEIRLDRKSNPHLSFGFGPHLCLGAPHARLIVRSLLETLTQRVGRITVLEAKEHLEHEARYECANGFDSLTVAFKACKAIHEGCHPALVWLNSPGNANTHQIPRASFPCFSVLVGCLHGACR